MVQGSTESSEWFQDFLLIYLVKSLRRVVEFCMKEFTARSTLVLNRWCLVFRDTFLFHIVVTVGADVV